MLFTKQVNTKVAALGAALCLLAPDSFAGPLPHCEAKNTPLRVHYFVNDNTSEGEFWNQNIAFAKWVAASLDIELSIQNIEPDFQHRVMFHDVLFDAMEQNTLPPHYFIGPLFHKGSERLFTDLEELKTPYFSVNTTLLHRQKSEYGEPREKSPYWIGHIAPNDRESAYEMARLATERVLKRKKNPVVVIIAGRPSDTVSIARINGFMQGLMEYGIFPTQTFNTDWAQASGERSTFAAIKRFETIDMLFTASSLLSKGAVNALTNKTRAKSIEHHSFDWNHTSTDLTSDNSLTSAFGGHFIETGLALVLLHDHYHGVDFNDHYGRVSFTTQMSELDVTNVERINQWLDNKSWETIDIKQYSRCYNAAADIESLTPISLIDTSHHQE